jgi:hypothetical protein
MANSYFTNPIHLDTFTSKIDIAQEIGAAQGTPIKLKSIAFSNCVTVGQVCTVADSYGGTPIFKEKLDVANKTITREYDGIWARNLVVSDSSLVNSTISITLE